jgi:hypothetical protein
MIDKVPASFTSVNDSFKNSIDPTNAMTVLNREIIENDAASIPFLAINWLRSYNPYRIIAIQMSNT